MSFKMDIYLASDEYATALYYYANHCAVVGKVEPSNIDYTDDYVDDYKEDDFEQSADKDRYSLVGVLEPSTADNTDDDDVDYPEDVFDQSDEEGYNAAGGVLDPITIDESEGDEANEGDIIDVVQMLPTFFCKYKVV